MAFKHTAAGLQLEAEDGELLITEIEGNVVLRFSDTDVLSMIDALSRYIDTKKGGRNSVKFL